MSRASHQLLTSSAHSPNLQDHVITGAAVFPATASATLNFFEAGFLRADTNDGQTVLASEWANQTLGSVSIAAPYEIRMGATTLTGDALNTWLSMVGGAGGARSWTKTRSALGSAQEVCTVQIRNAATGNILATGTYTFVAQVSSP